MPAGAVQKLQAAARFAVPLPGMALSRDAAPLGFDRKAAIPGSQSISDPTITLT